MTVRLLDERRYDPPRDVEVLNDGAWWPGTQAAWRLCDDARGWTADVRWTQQHEWGLGTYVQSVAAHRVRLPAQ